MGKVLPLHPAGDTSHYCPPNTPPNPAILEEWYAPDDALGEDDKSLKNRNQGVTLMAKRLAVYAFVVLLMSAIAWFATRDKKEAVTHYRAVSALHLEGGFFKFM